MKKNNFKILLFLCFALGYNLKLAAQEINKAIVPSNPTEPNISKLTFVERLNLKNAKVGQLVYDTSVGAYYIYSGSQWILAKELNSNAAGGPILNAGAASMAPNVTFNGTGINVGTSLNPITTTATFDLATAPTVYLRVPGATLSAGGTIRMAGDLVGSLNTTPTIGSEKITEGKIAASAITADKIALGSINSGHIIDGSIYGSDLGDMGAAAGQVLSFDGSSWGPATIAAGGGGSGFLGTYTAVNRATSDAVKDSLNLNNGTPADVNITGLFGQAIAATDQLSSVGLSFANNTYTNNSGATVYVRVSTNITFRRNYIDNAERLVWLEYLPNGGSGVTVARANSKGVVLANQTLSLSGVTLKLANGDGFAIKARSAGGDATNPVFVGGLSAVDNLTIDRVK